MMTHKLIKTDNYLLVVDDTEIKVGDNCLCDIPAGDYFGVVAYNGAFAEHYYKKIIAHLTLNGAPILEGVDLLPALGDVKQIVEEEYSRHVNNYGLDSKELQNAYKAGIWDGYNKAREKYKYTEEDVIKLIEKSRVAGLSAEYLILASQYPTEFECETEPYTVEEMSKLPPLTINQKPKTITINGRRTWVGKYK